MMNGRINTRTDTIEDAIIKMSDGNPGCLSFLAGLLKESRHGGIFGGASYLFVLDRLGIYGSRAYMLWNDCCRRDIALVETVLQNYKKGVLSADDIFAHLKDGWGTPFNDLIPICDLPPADLSCRTREDEWK